MVTVLDWVGGEGAVMSIDYNITWARGGVGVGGIYRDPNCDNVIFGPPLKENCISLLST